MRPIHILFTVLLTYISFNSYSQNSDSIALRKNFDYYLTQSHCYKNLEFLSTKIAGGFVGSMYALYATSNGMPTSNKVYYDWFECRSEDDVYKK